MKRRHGTNALICSFVYARIRTIDTQVCEVEDPQLELSRLSDMRDVARTDLGGLGMVMGWRRS